MNYFARLINYMRGKGAKARIVEQNPHYSSLLAPSDTDSNYWKDKNDHFNQTELQIILLLLKTLTSLRSNNTAEAKEVVYHNRSQLMLSNEIWTSLPRCHQSALHTSRLQLIL